jgi:hypothetical protein
MENLLGWLVIIAIISLFYATFMLKIRMDVISKRITFQADRTTALRNQLTPRRS